MNGDISELRKLFLEVAERHAFAIGERPLTADFIRKLRREYVASCMRDGMDIPSAIAEGYRLFSCPQDSNNGFSEIIQNSFEAIGRVGATCDAPIFVAFLNMGFHDASARRTEHGYLVPG